MARWRLTAKHYLNIPGVEWEYQETMSDGTMGRKRFPVPKFLDPDSPRDQNYPGEIVVSHKPHLKDYVFTGDPTPDMEPLDDEAEAITNATRHKWIHPIESLPGQGDFSQSLLTAFQRQLDALASHQPMVPVAPVSESVVGKSEFDELKARLEELMGVNAQLQAQLAEKPRRL